MFQDFHWRRCSAKRLPELLSAGRGTCAMLQKTVSDRLKKNISTFAFSIQPLS